MKLVKIILKFFQRITNDRYDRFPVTKEAKIASLRREVQRIVDRA